MAPRSQTKPKPIRSIAKRRKRSSRTPNRETIKAMRELEEGRGDSFDGSTNELFGYILGRRRR
jgi:hypothetical protein